MMKDFAQLFTNLDQTTKTNEKVAALEMYFNAASERDKLWTIALLSHRRPRRTVTTTLLRQWAAEFAGIPLWIFEESYHIVGDLAETIALVLPPPQGAQSESLSHWIDYIRSLSDLEEEEKKARIFAAWSAMTYEERFIFNKLITGGFRVGVSQKLMTKGLARHTGLDENVVAHRLMGDWSPGEVGFRELLFEGDGTADLSKPYPFFLAHPLEDEPQSLGEGNEWQFERKWDGIRGQLIVRQGELFVWSRGEELLTDKFPELHSLTETLPDGTVLDGEIMPYKDGAPLPFQILQTRIGRKNVTKKSLQEAPVIFKAYDVLEWEGKDIRSRPLIERRALLEDLPFGGSLHLSELVEVATWEEMAAERERAREFMSEGLMIKRKSSKYQTGRKRGDWWKYKIDPYTIDAVMIYAQRGHGRRANLYTDFTFAVWDEEGQLVPFAKAYSGLTDNEFYEVTNWVRRNTIERFGPVRSVKAELVFEIAFEGINRSTRHKSGVALRFPRIARWRKDKKAEEADTLEGLMGLLE
jgi:DNA ligase-1